MRRLFEAMQANSVDLCGCQHDRTPVGCFGRSRLDPPRCHPRWPGSLPPIFLPGTATPRCPSTAPRSRASRMPSWRSSWPCRRGSSRPSGSATSWTAASSQRWVGGQVIAAGKASGGCSVCLRGIQQRSREPHLMAWPGQLQLRAARWSWGCTLAGLLFTLPLACGSLWLLFRRFTSRPSSSTAPPCCSQTWCRWATYLRAFTSSACYSGLGAEWLTGWWCGQGDADRSCLHGQEGFMLLLSALLVYASRRSRTGLMTPPFGPPFWPAPLSPSRCRPSEGCRVVGSAFGLPCSNGVFPVMCIASLVPASPPVLRACCGVAVHVTPWHCPSKKTSHGGGRWPPPPPTRFWEMHPRCS